MKTEFITIQVKRDKTRDELRRERQRTREELARRRVRMIACVMVALLGIALGIIIGICTTGVDGTQTPEPQPQQMTGKLEIRSVEALPLSEVAKQQMTGKLELPSAEVIYAIEAMEKIQSSQVSYACMNPEKAHAWDVPLAKEELDALLKACEDTDLAPEIAFGLIQVESSFQSDALNDETLCYGYCQLNPEYFPTGLSTVENIQTGIAFLAEQLERYGGDMEAALTAYNAGHDTGSRTYANKVLAAAASFAGEVVKQNAEA